MKRIKGNKDYYINCYGDIYSTKCNKWHKLKPFQDKGGYWYCDLSFSGVTQRYSVHRLVAQHYCQGYFKGAVVNHIDGNKSNNYFENLEWCTTQMNVHASYQTSGVDAMRNYKIYALQYPDGHISCWGKGFMFIKEIIEKEQLNISPSSLQKYLQVPQGYKLLTREKCNDYSFMEVE